MRHLAAIFVAFALSSPWWLDAAFSVALAENKADTEPLRLGQERAPAGEDKVIAELTALQVAIMKIDPTKRGQHGKHHGCVEAEFVVRDDIPREYKVGLFREPKVYKAKVRFSNGAFAKDMNPDVHGMAIKILGVKG